MRSFYSLLACVILTAYAGRTAQLLPDIDPKLAQAEVERQNAIFLVDYRDKLIHASQVYATIARANADECARPTASYTGMLTIVAAEFPAQQRQAARRGSATTQWPPPPRSPGCSG